MGLGLWVCVRDEERERAEEGSYFWIHHLIIVATSILFGDSYPQHMAMSLFCMCVCAHTCL